MDSINFLAIIFSGLLGLIIGSFLNCVIWRTHKSESLWGRSYCPKCRHQIAWHDNIPVFSFLALLGKCRHCRRPISWQYPLVEMMTALLFILAWLKSSSLLFGEYALFFSLARDWLFFAGLVIIFVYDWRWQLIPMTLVWGLIVAVFIFNILLGFSWFAVLVAAAAGCLFFALQYFLTGRKGIGEGDIWLGILIGSYFGDWRMLAVALLFAYLLGGAVATIWLILKQKSWENRVALGPFLVIGAVLAFAFGSIFLNRLFGFE